MKEHCPADVILQQKQMEAALVSFNDSAFVNRAEGLSKLFFKFDKLGVMGSTAQLRLRFLLLVFCPDHWLAKAVFQV
jgi:hypothetical protein